MAARASGLMVIKPFASTNIPPSPVTLLNAGNPLVPPRVSNVKKLPQMQNIGLVKQVNASGSQIDPRQGLSIIVVLPGNGNGGQQLGCPPIVILLACPKKIVLIDFVEGHAK